MSSELNTRDRVLLSKVLLEIYGKEQQLHTALQAQIANAQTDAIRELLEGHLAVTDRQIDAISSRLHTVSGGQKKRFGIGPIAAGAGAGIATIANRGLSLAKGPLQVLRGTSAADQQLRNLRDCYWNEAEEIAHYHVLEATAEELGDTTTANLARRHRAEEEEMQRALEELLPVQVSAVVAREAPPAHRASVKATPKPVSRAKTTNSATKRKAAAARPKAGSAAAGS